jgi:hypothetical protein
MSPEDQAPESKMNPEDLYLEEVFTDRRAGAIRRLSPVTRDGSPDDSRAVVYLGQAQVLTAMGAMPLSFEIPASSLGEAIEKFPGAAKEAVERTARELQELRREAASSIVVPEAGGLGGPGGIPGGGKIQIP